MLISDRIVSMLISETAKACVNKPFFLNDFNYIQPMKMKFAGFAILIATVLTGFVLKERKQRIVFLGDSITQAGVDPNGYITVLKGLVAEKGLDKKYEMIGAGISGNKVTDLFLRLDTDVVAQKPSTVVIWIGVNDVWHKKSGTGTDPRTFEKFYELIIAKLQKKKAKVILCTPAAIGEKSDGTNEQDADLNKYADIIRNLAQKNNCGLVDLRKLFVDYDVTNNKEDKESGILTSDGVHLNDTGNRFVADEFFKVLVEGK
jgi:lysophospholipase L1-like esterase